MVFCKTFDEFKQKLGLSFTASFPKIETPDNWINATCDCANYFKLFMCEHIVGLALRKKLVTAPIEAKNVPLGMKRKRGRPCKAKNALVVQDI